jgi:hypothetical protein
LEVDFEELKRVNEGLRGGKIRGRGKDPEGDALPLRLDNIVVVLSEEEETENPSAFTAIIIYNREN